MGVQWIVRAAYLSFITTKTAEWCVRSRTSEATECLHTIDRRHSKPCF